MRIALHWFGLVNLHNIHRKRKMTSYNWQAISIEPRGGISLSHIILTNFHVYESKQLTHYVGCDKH